ncbi:hypothetical protein GCM10020229_07430 [Kitasatospora albolonga]
MSTRTTTEPYGTPPVDGGAVGRGGIAGVPVDDMQFPPPPRIAPMAIGGQPSMHQTAGVDEGAVGIARPGQVAEPVARRGSPGVG